MPVRPFVMWPDTRLKTPAEPVAQIDDEIRAIWDDMIETMEVMLGVGLAAPQIGVMRRLAVVDASHERSKAIRLANPVIIDTGEEMRVHEEASPNLPGVSAKLKRPAWVLVSYLDHLGFQVRKEFEGLWATSVQHQIDHLDGKLFIDRLGRVKRDMLLKKLRKRA